MEISSGFRNLAQSPRRIMITGAAGAGKTTLAKRLSQELGLPVFDLDAVVFEDGAGQRRPFAERLTLARQIATRPEWIAEGNYLWWAEELYAAADLIVWLDTPWYIAMPWMIGRHIRNSLKGTNRHRGVRRLLRWVWRYRGYYFTRKPDSPTGPDDDLAGNRAATRLFLQQYAQRLVEAGAGRMLRLWSNR